MRTTKQLELELEKLNYRIDSLSAISERRDMLAKEKEELETLNIRCGSIKTVIRKGNEVRQAKFESANGLITIFAVILFGTLTAYSIYTASSLMNTGISLGKQVMMASTALVTLVLTFGLVLSYTKRYTIKLR